MMIGAVSAADINNDTKTVSTNDNDQIVTVENDLNAPNTNTYSKSSAKISSEKNTNKQIENDLDASSNDESAHLDNTKNKESTNNNKQIVNAKNDANVLSNNPHTYSELDSEISSGGDITLKYDYYRYDTGDTISINGNNRIINGNGAIIDMAESTIQAFYVSGSGVTIKNLTIKNVNYDGDGGAIYFLKEGTVENCNFTNNSASGDGGAIYFLKEGTVENCNFTNNTARYGGAILFASTGTVTNCNFTNNTASQWGGAIRFDGNGTVENCNFTNNKATSYDGGAIYFSSSSSIGTVTNCNFTNNTASQWGGAIRFVGNGTVENCNFTNNKATSYNGGAIYFSSSSSIGTITNCNFTNNTATWYGGAIYFRSSSSTGTVTKCIFINNTANTGYAIYDRGNLIVNHTIFLNNGLTSVIYCDGSSNLDYNWFGNNATNYIESNPQNLVYGLTLTNWLFLKATNTTDQVTLFNTSNITFKLYLYNSTNTYNKVSDYDNTQLYPINLNITSSKGTVDKSIAHLNDTIVYTATEVGTGSVTASISNVRYSIGLNIVKEEYETKITNLQFDPLFKDKPVTINGTLTDKDNNALAYQKITINITSNNGYNIYNYGYTDGKGKFSITLTPTISEKVNITATYDGNDTNDNINYHPTSYIEDNVNVEEVQYNITFDPIETSYDYNTTVTITGTVTTNYQTLDVTNVTISLNKGEEKTAELNDGRFTYTFKGTIGGINNITVTCKDATNTTQVFIKYPTKFTINNIPDFTERSSIDLIVNEENKYTGQVTVTIGTETYNIDIINGAGKLTITPKLAPGTYTATIKFAGNENYTEANASSNSFKINAKPVPPSPEPVTKQNTKIIAKNKIYKLAKYKTYTVTVKNKKGKPVKNTRVKLKIGKKTYTAKTNKKGIATFKIPNKKSNKKSTKKSYKITATLNKNAKNDKLTLQRGSKTNKATTNKNGIATFKIKTSKKKIRKYTITLKTTSGQVVKKQKVNLKVKGKTFKAKTNSKGKATFKINNLNKNGKYKTKITYNGNNNYNKSSKTVKLTVKE